jgi:hypothetical protein
LYSLIKGCFYAQKLDVNDSFEHFANRMFSGIWNGKSHVSFNSWERNGDYCMPYEAPQDEILEKTTAHIDKEEIDLPVSDLKYPLHSPWNASPANGDGIPSNQRRYMDLYDRKLEQTLYSDDDRDIFTVEDEKELDEMDRVLSAEDVEKFKVSTMQERRSVAIHPILCGTPGCRTNRPIVGTRVKCLDCEGECSQITRSKLHDSNFKHLMQLVQYAAHAKLTPQSTTRNIEFNTTLWSSLEQYQGSQYFVSLTEPKSLR